MSTTEKEENAVLLAEIAKIQAKLSHIEACEKIRMDKDHEAHLKARQEQYENLSAATDVLRNGVEK